jgi:hypothetical protein
MSLDGPSAPMTSVSAGADLWRMIVTVHTHSLRSLAYVYGSVPVGLVAPASDAGRSWVADAFVRFHNFGLSRSVGERSLLR